jgi:hypothetical protein
MAERVSMLIISLSLASLALSLLLAGILGRKNLFHPAVFFLLFATIDVFFPALYWAAFGQVNNPEWLKPLSSDQLLFGLNFYVVYLAVFIVCMLAVDGAGRPRLADSDISRRFQLRLLYTTGALLLLTLLKLALEAVAFGGLEAWFWSRLVFAAGLEVADARGTASSPLVALPLRETFQAAVGVGFFYRKKFVKWRWAVTFFFPAVAMALAMSTFLRGTVLTCAITLIFAEAMRRRSLVVRLDAPRSVGRRSRLLFVTLIAVFFSIYAFGAVRDSFRGVASSAGDANMELTVPTFLTAGHGLLGLSHITSEYGNTTQHILGATYIDMLLLPIPRSIYTSKPEWYGIDDITRGMGWPASTQSAVTMPGEAFANFGFFGLLVAIPFGLMFGWFHSFSRVSQTRYLLLGPVIFFQVVSVANWMSFTGVMNSVPLIALLVMLGGFIGQGGAAGPRLSSSR